MTLTERVQNILVKPRQEWEIIARELSSVAEMYRAYIMPLAAIGPLASIIGLSLIGFGGPMTGRYRMPLGSSILRAVVTFALSLAAVYVLALVINALAPSFSGEKNDRQAFKLAAYASTAAWLAGIFNVIRRWAFSASSVSIAPTCSMPALPCS